MYSITFSRAIVGIESPLVTVETHLSRGLPRFNIVGLPETVVKESKERVRSALINSRFEMPKGRITVNLAPAELPKQGGRFDLAIAIGILLASRQLARVRELELYEFAGELTLSGELRPIPGILSFAAATVKNKHQLVIARENAPTASLIQDLTIYTAHHLLDICAHLTGEQPLTSYQRDKTNRSQQTYPDLCDIQEQPLAKRALEIAAAGGHSLLMQGPPGTGKTMLANRLPGLLPPLNEMEALEVAMIHSIRKPFYDIQSWYKRPFRAPHHSASSVAIIGGGSIPRPGEISFAHKGVLFLDELPEFNRQVLESLREPLESKYIEIARAREQMRFPADFQLVAAMNPCPCGYLTHPEQLCQCSAEQIKQYQRKISGPLLDRIDIHIEVPTLKTFSLNQNNSYGEKSFDVQKRVHENRRRQLNLFQNLSYQLSMKEILKQLNLSNSAKILLEKASHSLHLSLRAQHRMIKIATTIALFNDNNTIDEEHIAEAISFRIKQDIVF